MSDDLEKPTEATPVKKTKKPRTTRISFLRVGVLVVVTTAVIAFGLTVFRPVVAPAAAPGATGFAPYVDVTTTPAYPFETPQGPNQQDVTLAFVVAGKDGCTPSWGGFYTMEEAADQLELDRRIAQLRSVGGNVRVSFGGQANHDLAITCTDVEALTAAYRSVVDRYELTSIDLDIEGPDLADAAAQVRRAQAIKAVQQSFVDHGRSLAVWLTLPTGLDGLTTEGQQNVRTMLAAGVDLTGVNGMTMNFNSGDAGSNMTAAVDSAATALHGQVRALYAEAGTKLDSTQTWGKVGLTPMIGQNDVPGEVFTLQDAADLNTFARENGVGLLSMWSLNRDGTCARPLPTVTTVVQNSCSGIDQQGVAFADVLGDDTTDPLPTPVSTATATPTPAPAPTEVVDDPATSPYQIWDPLGTYPAGTKVVWKHNVYQAKWWTSGTDPTTPSAAGYDSPWTLLGPVLPGDKPAPLPTVPAGTYDEWDAQKVYVAGDRVQIDGVPYQAKWWTQGQQPGEIVAGGSPWTLINPS
jgi:chitinase